MILKFDKDWDTVFEGDDISRKMLQFLLNKNGIAMQWCDCFAPKQKITQ